MEIFNYKAVYNKNGERVTGLVEAKDEQSAVEILRGKELVVTDIRPQSESSSFKFLLAFSKIKFDDIVNFTRQLATMVNAGLPILTSLQLLRKRAKPAMAKVVGDIDKEVENGGTLYSAMLNYPDIFNSIYLSLVKTGETAGVLGTVLERLSRTMERQHDFRQKVKSSMLYPIIVIVVMILVGIGMVFFIIPKISELYEQFETDLPGMTKIVLGVANFIRLKWYLFFLLILVLVFGILYVFQTEKGKKVWDREILKLPYIGDLQNKIISTNVLGTLSLLIQSGVSIVESLDITANGAGNVTYKEGIKNAAKDVEKGMSLSVAFGKQEIFSDMVIQMMAVGEETGKLSEMLEKISNQYNKDSLAALEGITKIIEPALIILLGVGVGVMVVSIIMPIYNLTSSI